MHKFKIGDKVIINNKSEHHTGTRGIVVELWESCDQLGASIRTKDGRLIEFYEYKYDLATKEQKIIKPYGIVKFLADIQKGGGE